MKTIIERGASWTLEETKLLLALWGQDLVQRQATNMKRTKEVYEKISEKFAHNGFERTADQVRTRVFNMIAEYRRILKDPNPERMKKCIFFEALHKIYQAKHMDDVKSALDDYEPEYPYSPASNTISSEKGDDSISDGEATDGNETISNTNINAATYSHNNNSNVKIDTNSINNDSDNIIADSNNATEKESSAPIQVGAATKKIRLDSPKSSQNQTNQSNTSNTGNSSSTQDNATTSITSSKQNKSTSVPLLATTIGGTPISSSGNTIRQQSLLMPHATASSTSTPITKLATSSGNNTPSYININSTKLPIIRTNQLIGHSNGNESINLNGTTTRLPTTAAITSHQLYQAPVNTFDVTSSALLIDRMFSHLSRESENMREWIALEKERLALERVRRTQETEREVRRERVLIDTLMRFQDQWLAFLARLDPRIVENSGESPPELKVPPREPTTSTENTSQSTSQTTKTTSSLGNTTTMPNAETDPSKQ